MQQGPAGSENDVTTRLSRIWEEAEKIAGVGSWRLELSTAQLTWSPGMYRIFDVDTDDAAIDLTAAA
jgi:hypothetical protein